jgi:hypothetical protein
MVIANHAASSSRWGAMPHLPQAGGGIGGLYLPHNNKLEKKKLKKNLILFYLTKYFTYTLVYVKNNVYLCRL